MARFDSDHVGSDDLEEILAYTRDEVASGSSSTTRVASSSRTQPAANENGVPAPSNGSYAARQQLDARLDSLDAEIASVDAETAKLKTLRAKLVAEKAEVVRQLDNMRGGRQPNAPVGKGKGKSKGGIDYNDDYEWTPDMKARMQRVFSIKDFRLCQQGVCNANMDRRDIVCIMPTGGGKSLTYQLPALFSPGCTVVISPLISLITDQILHLREAGVEAVMLTGATRKEETRNIMNRLITYDPSAQNGEKEIKLCYVTPEKVAKSKTFVSMLEKLANKGRLARLVIDEAHCVSQLGHDFRPDYKKLSILRQLFPRVPIMALSATCPPQVLDDVLKILRLPPVTDGAAANTTGTVYFSSPLYRPNLHYCVMPKPSGAAAAIQTMADYILASHAEDSGIVYCLSKKDTEAVATGLSERGIRSGIYHADIGDEEKERLHVRWRKGQVKVVCATIAFGLGIDKGDVRFVLHHTMSKSLEGYYQESGRAGRDGKDADCVLFYRGQDATRLSALVANEPEGQQKVHSMLKFAQDLRGCRKLLFADYFSVSSSLALSAWGAATDAGAKCGHCDNCRRSPDTFSPNLDVTLDAWRIVRVLSHITTHRGRVTIAILGDLVRGLGGGAFSAGGKKGKKSQQDKLDLDLDDVCGGKITLSKDDTETLVIHLLVSGYIQEDYSANAYTINVYVAPGPEAYRLSRRSREDIEAGSGVRVVCDFARPSKKTRQKASTRIAGGSKRKRTVPSEDEDDDIEDLDGDEDDPGPASRRSTKRRRTKPERTDLPADDDDDNDDFFGSLRRIDTHVLESSSDAADEWKVANDRFKKRTSKGDDEVIVISP